MYEVTSGCEGQRLLLPLGAFALLPDPSSACPSKVLSEENGPVLLVKEPWKNLWRNDSEQCTELEPGQEVLALSRSQNIKSASCSLISCWKISRCNQGPGKAPVF